MSDRLIYLKYLQYPSETITPSQFSSWKQSGSTRELFKELIKAVFDELDAPLPESFEQTIVTVHQREGALKLLDNLLRWEPATVTAARQKGEIVDED